jgi:nicotinate-nucleotide--dimethylbenzimidazole phosphoribosyltransferase
MTHNPLDDLRALMADLPPPDLDARQRFALVGRGLGELADIAGWFIEWRGLASLHRPIIALYAGSHAGVGDGNETRALMERIAAGGAPVCAAAGHLGAGLDVFDLAIDRPVGDPKLGPTMSERECAATMAFGMEVLAKQPDLLVLGALGEGARQAASAIGAAIRDPGAPLSLLRRLGGRETAAIAGAILAARTQRTPVLLEGASALAAAAVLHAADPDSIIHCRLGSAPTGPEASALAAGLGLKPLIDLKLTLADGTGSAAALSLIKLSLALAVEDGA